MISVNCPSKEIVAKLIEGIDNRVAELNNIMWSLKTSIAHVDDYNIQTYIYSEEQKMLLKLRKDLMNTQTC